MRGTPTLRQIAATSERAALAAAACAGISDKALKHIADASNDHQRFWRLAYAADREAGKLERIDPKAAAQARNIEREQERYPERKLGEAEA